MVELDERDRETLGVLARGRANPKLIRDETGLDKGDVNTVLVRLGRAGLVRQVTRGLYEITPEGRNEVGVGGGVADARDALERALDELPDDAPGRAAVEDARALLDDTDA